MRVPVMLFLVAALFGCAKPAPPKPLSEPGEKVYALKGTIVSRDAGEHSLRINHEAIAGFMEAMTMDYPVRGVSMEQLPPNGSKIEARLHVHDDKYWLTDIRKVP